MNANVEKIYQATSNPMKALKVTRENKENIMNNFLNIINELKDDVDIKPGDRYQIIVRKLDYLIEEYPDCLKH